MSEELAKKIADSISDEKHDIDKYHQMSEDAEKCGCKCIAGVLNDIAHDEHTHKALLEEMIKDFHITQEHN